MYVHFLTGIKPKDYFIGFTHPVFECAGFLTLLSFTF